jgi:type I restriction enzyme S subunit
VEAQDKIITAARELKKSPMRHLFIYGPVPLDQADQVPLKETEPQSAQSRAAV